MTHTGDDYERRARAARHAELRALIKAFSTLLVFGARPRKTKAAPQAPEPVCANDRSAPSKHAA